MIVLYLVASDCSFVFEPTVIWWSKGSRCFKPPKDRWRPMQTWPKSLLRKPQGCFILGQRYVSSWNLERKISKHQTCLSVQKYNMAIQPLDAGINRNFEYKYRKLLVCYVVTWWRKLHLKLIEDVHVLKVITWLQTDWKSISTEFIKQCFKKYRLDFGDILIINKQIDTKFQELFAQIYSKTALDEYINFDTDKILSEPAFHPTHVDWRQECPDKRHCKGLATRRTTKLLMMKKMLEKWRHLKPLIVWILWVILLEFMEISRYTWY